MNEIRLTPLMGYPVYYDTLLLFDSEPIDLEGDLASLVQERRVAISALGTTSFIVSSFHRPISKICPHVYRRRPKAFNSL